MGGYVQGTIESVELMACKQSNTRETNVMCTSKRRL